MSGARLALLLAGVALVGAARDASGQANAGVFELRCRGGENLFVIDGPAVTGSDTLSLSFGWSLNAAGPDGAGLDPGTCSWIDRSFRDGEPSQIHFTTTGPVQQVIDHLNDARNYWSFWVYNTNRGYMEATRNAPLKPMSVVDRAKQPPPVATQGNGAASDTVKKPLPDRVKLDERGMWRTGKKPKVPKKPVPTERTTPQ
jgi:hypothetical protein